MKRQGHGVTVKGVSRMSNGVSHGVTLGVVTVPPTRPDPTQYVSHPSMTVTGGSGSASWMKMT